MLDPLFVIIPLFVQGNGVVDGQVLCLERVSMNVDKIRIVVYEQTIVDTQDGTVVDRKIPLKCS